MILAQCIINLSNRNMQLSILSECLLPHISHILLPASHDRGRHSEHHVKRLIDKVVSVRFPFCILILEGHLHMLSVKRYQHLDVVVCLVREKRMN